MNNRQITTTITEITRLTNSGSGTPAWRLGQGIGGYVRTEPDSQCAFSVDPDHVGRTVRLTMNKQNRVVGYELTD